MWTTEAKSLLAPLYKREGIPLFGKEGLGEIFKEYVQSIMDSLVTFEGLPLRPSTIKIINDSFLSNAKKIDPSGGSVYYVDNRKNCLYSFCIIQLE